MKVACYTIAKNEESNVAGWASSTWVADYRVIVDTGSTDGTVEAAKDLGLVVHTISVHPWRFDDARNAALALLPGDVDYCISLDMDERLQPGWWGALEMAHAQRITRPRYRYVWSWTPEGDPDIVFARDHIHTRRSYRWKHPVHEILVPVGIEETTLLVPGLEVHHHPDPAKSRVFYLDLLELAVTEDPDDDRNAFYYARELMFAGLDSRAKEEFERHLSLGTWAPERAASMRNLSYLAPRVHPYQGIQAAEPWLLRACAEAPGYREPWLDLCRYYLAQGNGPMAQAVAQRALQIQTRQLEYLTESAAWDGTLEQLAGPGTD